MIGMFDQAALTITLFEVKELHHPHKDWPFWFMLEINKLYYFFQIKMCLICNGILHIQ